MSAQLEQVIVMEMQHAQICQDLFRAPAIRDTLAMEQCAQVEK